MAINCAGRTWRVVRLHLETEVSHVETFRNFAPVSNPCEPITKESTYVPSMLIAISSQRIALSINTRAY